jgi:hypothetical protein
MKSDHSNDTCLLLLLLQHQYFTAPQRQIFVPLIPAPLWRTSDESEDNDDDEDQRYQEVVEHLIIANAVGEGHEGEIG